MFTIHLEDGEAVDAQDFRLEPGWVIALVNGQRRAYPDRRVAEVAEN